MKICICQCMLSKKKSEILHRRNYGYYYIYKTIQIYIFSYDQFCSFSRQGITKYLLVTDSPLNLSSSKRAHVCKDF